jgi:hypothetical protein
MEEDRELDERLIKEVMAYFGEELGGEDQAEAVMRYVVKAEHINAMLSFEFMNGIREVLIKRGFDVPFRVVYKRRTK